ncbi:hypothetical protein [Glutamicibacter sp.]|uniref:hypothetical protein n=1 Tax=Glutamicibacter sp. TaxID=1931995 RepID=UPI0028BEA391|nr:hypothetical protein [Glutamicibacter sp.]
MSSNQAVTNLKTNLEEQELADQVTVSRADLERVLKYIDDVAVWMEDFDKQFGGKP